MSLWYACAVDLVVAVVLGLLYLRRHGRRDLVFAYTALNVGVFAVVSVLLVASVELAVGFGLFGVLAILRLRSEAITQTEVAYYFVAIALGLVTAVTRESPLLLLGLDALLLAVLFAADHPRLLARTRRHAVTLDVVHRDPATLRADLERRLGGTVRAMVVTEVDYVRDLMVVDVRLGGAPSWPARAAEHSGGVERR